MKRHKWGKPQPCPPGAAEVCLDCGKVRFTAIPGYQKSKSGGCPGRVGVRHCQMTIAYPAFPGAGWDNYSKCGSPAKFRVPNPKMGVEYVCGVHARVLDAMYKRTGQELKCEPLVIV